MDTASKAPLNPPGGPAASQAQAKHGASAGLSSEPDGKGKNLMRAQGDTATKRPQMRPAMPPLEDRFNLKRTGLVETDYHFRDQAGKLAFTDKAASLSTTSESPAAIKAMVDRAAERGWATVRLSGSPEFVRQGWIAATAQGIKAVGHSPTPGDRDAATQEGARLQLSHDAPVRPRPGEATPQRPSPQAERAHTERANTERGAPDIAGQRQLAAAIEKALVDGKVAPELRGQVRAMMAAEGARRAAGGERFKVPVYDPRAPRARAKLVKSGPERQGDRERSR